MKYEYRNTYRNPVITKYEDGTATPIQVSKDNLISIESLKKAHEQEFESLLAIIFEEQTSK